MNFSPITDNLFIGTSPSRRDFETLRDLGVSLVINMRWMPGPRPLTGDPAMRYMWLHTFDNPFLPIPLRSLLRGVQEALKELQAGGKVYTHCAKGRHRSVAMAAAILIAQGTDPLEAIHLIKERRPISDPHIFYIRRRIELFHAHWLELQQPLLTDGIPAT
jgi:dual specificity MAP kinase phosphatase